MIVYGVRNTKLGILMINVSTKVLGTIGLM